MRAMDEKEFQGLVEDLARVHGWEVFHPYNSRKSREGWPDLALWRPGAFMLRELKTDVGVVSPSQRSTLLSLGEAGVDVGVWRPRDYDRIVVELSAPRVRRDLDEAERAGQARRLARRAVDL